MLHYFVVIILCIASVFSQNVSDPFKLSIIHFNDFHARFEETTPSGGTCKQTGQCIGGFSRLYKQIMTMLEETPNAVLLNAGDDFQGTIWYSMGRWNVTQTFMNKLPIDAETLGNHEFDNGIGGIVPYIKALQYPIVVSNMDDSDEPEIQNIYQKSVVIERFGKKIGIIGVVRKDYPILASTGKLKFYDESESINKEAERLVEEESVFTNIILSHCGYEIDQQLARNASEKISIIVGAHSHTFLFTGDNPPGPAEVEGPYPTIVTSKHGHNILITQASAYCRYLGNITIFLDEDGEILEYSGAPIFLDSNLLQDDDINAALEPWKILFDNQGNQVVGSSFVKLDSTSCYRQECTLGNYVTDAMVYEYSKNVAENVWTNAAIAFTNPGGLRTDIEVGDITYNDMVTACPFENTLDFGVIQGKYLKELLEYTVAPYSKDKPNASLKLLQVSGIQVVYDLSRIVGDRVISAKIRCQNCTIPIYEDLDENKDYPLVINSFIAEGGSGYQILIDNLKNRTIGPVDIDVLVEFTTRKYRIFQEEFGRITFK
ncbi:apyrase-like [Diorhabda carinulata]|uniref:apyrase-like n=1 Tax=Diorhabda carinulata TaxID=1163345 RepID=UPI0025A21473|nr:apyrase-like [Diorhabda carinulata]